MLSQHKISTIPAGTIELFGEEAEKRMHVIRIIESVYQKFGFDPLLTPSLEFAKVFNGHHGEGETLLFKLSDSKNEKLVLRYDLTVPFARFIGSYRNLPIPFKRYQISSVFRDDEVDKGHFREFTQCDGDVVGIKDLSADAEIIHLAFQGLTSLGFKKFFINISHRKILRAIANRVGLGNKEGVLLIQRAFDAVSKFTEKFDYQDADAEKKIAKEIPAILANKKLPQTAMDLIQLILSYNGNLDEKLLFFEKTFSDFPEAITGIKELREIISYVKPEIKKVLKIDFSLARGADYYTGFILEGSVPDVPVGAILGGGRFDNLVKALGGPDLPAVGMAFGLDRIMVALKDLGLLDHSSSAKRILVTTTTEEKKKQMMTLAGKFRGSDLITDFIPLVGLPEELIEKYACSRNFSLLLADHKDGVQLKNLRGTDNLVETIAITIKQNLDQLSLKQY